MHHQLKKVKVVDLCNVGVWTSWVEQLIKGVDKNETKIMLWSSLHCLLDSSNNKDALSCPVGLWYN